MKNKSGFTLLEMLIVLAIIGMLGSLITQALPFLKEKTRDKRRIHELANLQRQIELYHNENGAYPSTVAGVGTFYSFFTEGDAFSSTYSPAQVTQNYVPGMVPNYFQELPVDPLPGPSTISGCYALGYARNIAYFSNGDYYKIIYHCASETDDYDPTSQYYDPSRPDWAWAASNDMDYTTYTLGW